MSSNRTANATRNILFGLILKTLQILLPFFIRTAMIRFLGVQYLGLNSLFTSVIQVLSLAELGVGSAMVFSMYKPIAEGDKTQICALLNMYKVYYRVIGVVIAIFGIILLPFVPMFIKSDLPSDVNIYILYLLNLSSTVLSYFLFAYRNSLLQAHQRMDVVSKCSLTIMILQYVIQFFVLWIFHNYYFYIVVALFTQIMSNIFIAYISKKMYPEFSPEGSIPKEERKTINRRIKDLFTSRLGSVILDSADSIVISAFLGLTILAVYQNYFYILSSVMGFITIIFNSITAGIGNSLVTDTKEKNFNDFKKLSFLICWISGICVCCFLNLYQPFMLLWVGNKLMMDYGVVICLIVYFFVQQVSKLFNTYKDAAGIWHEDRFRPFIVAISNLFMNLVTVQFMGIYGVILSTVISTLFISFPWLLHNIFNNVFTAEYFSDYLKRLLRSVVIVFIVSVITVLLCYYIFFENLVLTILLRLFVCLIVPNLVFYVLQRHDKEFEGSIILLDRMTKGKFYLKKLIISKKD